MHKSPRNKDDFNKDFAERWCEGERKIFFPLFQVFLSGLIIKLTLTEENDQMCYICTYRGPMRIWDPRANQAVKAYSPS